MDDRPLSTLSIFFFRGGGNVSPFGRELHVSMNEQKMLSEYIYTGKKEKPARNRP